MTYYITFYLNLHFSYLTLMLLNIVKTNMIDDNRMDLNSNLFWDNIVLVEYKFQFRINKY